MECREIRDALVQGQAPLGADVDAHLAACPGCAELLVDDGQLGQALATSQPPELDASALLGGVLGSIEKERGMRAWLRSRSMLVRVGLPLAAVLLVLTYVLLFKRRPDVGSWLPVDFGVAVALYALLIGAAVVLELRPLELRPLPAWLRPVLVTLALALPVLFVWLPQAHHAPLAYAPPGKSFGQLAFGCFAFGTALALPALALLWAADRVGHRSFRLALLAAAIGGLIGNLVLQFHCPITDPAHLLVGHATIGLVLGGVYAAWLMLRTAPLGRRQQGDHPQG